MGLLVTLSLQNVADIILLSSQIQADCYMQFQLLLRMLRLLSAAATVVSPCACQNEGPFLGVCYQPVMYHRQRHILVSEGHKLQLTVGTRLF